MDLVQANHERDLWLTDGQNCVFIPQGWYDDFCVGNGCEGGPDCLDDDGQPTPELYGYGALADQPNADVGTLFFSVAELQQMDEITEAEARRIHPKLAAHLDSINSGE